MIRLVVHAARMTKTRNSYKISVGKTEGKRPFGRPKLRWGIILERIYNRVRSFGLDSYESVKEPLAGLVNTAVNCGVP
jgi:hypothetical protein